MAGKPGDYPDVPGLGVESHEEVEQLIREAITFHLDGLRPSRRADPAIDHSGTTRVEVPAA